MSLLYKFMYNQNRVIFPYSITCTRICILEMATGRASRGPGLKIQARGLYGPNDFLFRSPLCIVRWPLGSNTCGCVLNK